MMRRTLRACNLDPCAGRTLATLQAKVELFSTENDALSATVTQLREEIVNLKTLLLAHKECPVSHHGAAMNNFLGSDMNHQNPPEILDLKAHRKALEAELYTNMESPKERFARLDRLQSATAEYHQYVLDFEEYDNFEDRVEVPLQHAIDSNGFESVAIRDVSLDIVTLEPTVVDIDPAIISSKIAGGPIKSGVDSSPPRRCAVLEMLFAVARAHFASGWCALYFAPTALYPEHFQCLTTYKNVGPRVYHHFIPVLE
jgi:hypothetical protein